tara:strand:+ start:5158 stop:6753 length:1596 start_codon:yes stop_codon:yes gene_type:complete
LKLRAAVIVDDLKIKKWQQLALNAAREKIDVKLFLNCRNTHTKKKYLKNFLYFVLNFFSLKTYLTKKKKINHQGSEIINFDSIYDGNWQSIPNEIYKKLKDKKIDVIIKFGMNLLRVADDNKSISIISYHHGDPTKYRGRPAGFYETLNNELTSGIIVQELNNDIDGGKILAFANSRVINYSYRLTAKNFYLNSEHLLHKAIDNKIKCNFIKLNKKGKIYRLPSNPIVIKFIAILIKNLILKIFYGLFIEKKWKVAILENKLKLKGKEIIRSSEFINIPIRQEYNFYADAFYSFDESKIRLEALRTKTGLGDILEIDTNDFFKQKKILSGNHYSYPFSFLYKGNEYIMPEVASHSSQYISPANDFTNTKKHYIKGLEKKRIVDATLINKDGYYFLFFGERKTSQTSLNLWYSESPFGNFYPHPLNPIIISPQSARMGGSIVHYKDRIIRFGQNNSGEYGESLSILEVINLSSLDYKEELVGSIFIDKYKGPHSLNFNSNFTKIIIDYYTNKFSLFSGIRRIKAKLKEKKYN